ncbi:MAG: hypothetical protein M1831_002809 [Alyxoria varia]|nr:MAG: hypothetical protein M1831_002809 [Alyxoria varia]
MAGRCPAICYALQITAELKHYHKVGNLEDVRVIRDKKTGNSLSFESAINFGYASAGAKSSLETGHSRQFGFLRFASVEEATAFMDQNFPMIYLYGSTSGEKDAQAAKVRIAFSKERENREKPDDGWTCPICSVYNYSRRSDCIRCHTKKDAALNPELSHNKPTDFLNTGDRDVSEGENPLQFLLFRGLEPSVTEELLAKGATKLLKSDESSPGTSGPGKITSTSAVANAGARANSIRRVLLVRDKKTGESWRYGFVEFAKVEDARDALARFNSLERFTISSKPVMVSHTHTGVFVPALNTPPDKEKELTFAATTNPSLRLTYWDKDAFAKEYIVSMPAQGDSSKDGIADKAEKKQKVKGNTEGQDNSDQAKTKKRKAETTSSNPAKKALPAHLQFWTDRHHELHGKATEENNEEDNSSNTTGSQAIARDPSSQPSQQSYADPKRMCCFLCSRQFKSTAQINQHERLSDLHRSNLKKEDLVKQAREKLEKAGIPVHGQEKLAPAAQQSGVTTEPTGEYRDRAKERRETFKQPKQPGFNKFSLPTKKPEASNTPPSAKSASPPAPQAAQQPSTSSDDVVAETPVPKSKGASLLGKMGWTAGEGLGAAGRQGATAPIKTEMYEPGVGIGAEGGKVGDAVEEASRNTGGSNADFAEKAKEKARARYERLG